MAINEAMVQDAVNRVLHAAPGSRVIVFGSWARGDASPDSDLDILVVEPEVKNRYGEMVRLARLLGEQLVPADVIVISQSSLSVGVTCPTAWLGARRGRAGSMNESHDLARQRAARPGSGRRQEPRKT